MFMFTPSFQSFQSVVIMVGEGGIFIIIPLQIPSPLMYPALCMVWLCMLPLHKQGLCGRQYKKEELEKVGYYKGKE